jgi:NAD(P)-dependent dehydrogenase (short-subunit alcohol dehydrogenase family)
MDFKEKNILVVGGTSGIGLSLVTKLIDDHSNVYGIPDQNQPTYLKG